MTKIADASPRYARRGKGRHLSNLAGASLFLVLGGLLGACSTGSDGFSDGEIKEAPDKALVRSILGGLGAVDQSEKPIEYLPRAPLAMPANLDGDLPQPEQAQTAANWPEKDETELKKIQAIYASSPLPGDRLTPEQLRGLPELASASRDPAEERKQANEADGERLPVEELTKKRKLKKADTASLFGPDGQPIRRYLIEPPIAYSTPVGDAPLVAPEKVQEAPVRDDWAAPERQK